MTLDKDEEQVLEPTEVVEEQPEEQQEAPNEEESAQEGSEESAEEAGDPDEVVVTLGDEPAAEEEPPEAAAKWVRELRKSHREATKRARELEKEVEALKAKPAAQEVEEVGAEPTLESCDYDEEKFKADWRAWNKRADEKKEQERKKQEEGAKAQAEWQATLNAYNKRKSEFKVSDFDEAEAAAIEILGETKVCMVVDAADNPEVAVYVLGKNPKRAKELAAITNPVKFGKALEKLEKDMKVTPKRAAPLPETTVRSNARVSAGVDSTLERLRAEADRTGDRTKVAQYMRQQAAKKKA